MTINTSTQRREGSRSRVLVPDLKTVSALCVKVLGKMPVIGANFVRTRPCMWINEKGYAVFCSPREQDVINFEAGCKDWFYPWIKEYDGRFYMRPLYEGDTGYWSFWLRMATSKGNAEYND